MDPIFFLFIPGLLLALTLHELGHALVAYWGGDDTAARQGRLTINPIPHIDLFGTLILPALLFISGTRFLFGWAKPVPVDVSRLRGRAWRIGVALAGPGANLILLVVSALVYKLFEISLWRLSPGGVESGGALYAVALVLKISIILNFVLMSFNLLPIPPLDGSRVAYELFFARSPGAAALFRQLETFGMLLLLLLYQPISGVLRHGLAALGVFLEWSLGISL